MQHIRSLCARLADRTRERSDEIGRDIIEWLCSDQRYREEKSVGFVAAVATEIYRIDSKLHGS